MKQQTAVEWFNNESLKLKFKLADGEIIFNEYRVKCVELFEQAKAMEKEQMKKCYGHAAFSLIDMGHGDSFEEYYNETYNHDSININ